MVYIDIYINLANNMEIKKKQTTDFILSKNIYQLDRIVQEPGDRVQYYLQNDPIELFWMEN